MAYVEEGKPSVDPLGNQEKQMSAIMEKIAGLENEIQSQKTLVSRLKELIQKLHARCYQPTTISPEERR